MSVIAEQLMMTTACFLDISNKRARLINQKVLKYPCVNESVKFGVYILRFAPSRRVQVYVSWFITIVHISITVARWDKKSLRVTVLTPIT